MVLDQSTTRKFSTNRVSGGGGSGVEVVWIYTGCCWIFCNKCDETDDGDRELYLCSNVSISSIDRSDDRSLEGTLTAVVGRTC